MKVRKIKAIVELETEHSETIFRSILPEMQGATSERYIGKLKKDDNRVRFEFEANDVVALRAAINAYLRWIKAICDVCEIIKGGN